MPLNTGSTVYITDMPESLNNTIPSFYANDTEIYVSSKNSSDLIFILNDDLSGWVKINYKFFRQSHNIWW